MTEQLCRNLSGSLLDHFNSTFLRVSHSVCTNVSNRINVSTTLALSLTAGLNEKRRWRLGEQRARHIGMISASVYCSLIGSRQVLIARRRRMLITASGTSK